MKNKAFYLLIFCISFLNVNAQENNSKTENLQQDKYAYVDAIKTYERIYEKGYKTPDMLQKLGDASYFKADLKSAAKWYGELFSMTQDLETEFFYRYSQSLKAVGEHQKSDEMMAKFNARNSDPIRG